MHNRSNEDSFVERFEQNKFVFDVWNGRVDLDEYQKLLDLVLEVKAYYIEKKDIDKRIMLHLYDIASFLYKKTIISEDPFTDMWCEVDDAITAMLSSKKSFLNNN